ncbi:renal dipeptidase [Xylaria grammica]|nr:renal dipeptidase [Xylaria grammica]
MPSTNKQRPAPRSTRRASSLVAVIGIICFSVAFTLHRGAAVWIKQTSKSNDIFQLVPLIDGHIDFPIWIRAFYQNHIYQDNFTSDGPLSGQVDFPRLMEGKLGAAFWSAYVECSDDTNNNSDEVYREIIHDTLQQVDLVHRLIKEYPESLQHAYTAADVERIFEKYKTSRISSMIGIEGLHQIGNSASILRMYYALGVRYATLTHTCHNKYADSEEPAEPLHGGLSEAGKSIVAEMNRLGMIVDLSHTSFNTQRDVLKISAAPVIFSHSNAYGLYNHTRNVPDDVLEALRENQGVIMATFYPQFLGNDTSKASLFQVADHIEYIGGMIGYRYVGIGSDFDGMANGPSGLEDVSKYPQLVMELQRRGLRDADIRGVMGLNILRVFKNVEGLARSMRHVRPLEDDVKPFFSLMAITKGE